MLLDDLKWGSILASKAMVLASHGENFGVSLVESLSLGKPVLTTNKVNIHKEILRDKAGFISKDNVYDVTLHDRGFTCDCPGFSFRGRCKHSQQILRQVEGVMR